MIHEMEISIKDACGIMAHVKQKAESICTMTGAIEENVYKDIYWQALRESGAYTLERIPYRFLSAVHNAIDSYKLPKVIEAQIVKRMEEDGVERNDDK